MKIFVDEQRAAPSGWTTAKTIGEAIELLATTPVEVISMDYDIDVFPGSGQTLRSNESFEPIVRYVALMPKNRRPEVIYHTQNPRGEARMRSIMKEVE